MKTLFLTCFLALTIAFVSAQNYISGPVGLYGSANNAATTVATGGAVVVGNGGNWAMAGNIISADKGNGNAPTATGRAELITFSGTGTYSGATTTAGSTGFVIDGYAATTGQAADFVLPLGNATTAYPVTVPAGASVTAAYFDGSGSSQNVPVNNLTTTEYSPYIDMPNGIVAGSYTFGYPSGFSNTLNSSLLSSDNTSASGTSGSTAYSLLTTVPTFAATASTTTATLPTKTATQVYFASSAVVLPVNLTSFTATPYGCMANLAWQTASEQNSSYYAIEASLDGHNFSQVGKVQSKNSAIGAAYNTSTLLLGEGINYFRLKIVDVDGKNTYSAIVAVAGTGECGAGLSVKVSPNPTTNVLNIQGLVSGSRLTLLNLNGQQLAEVIATGTTQRMDIANYANGIYVLRVQTSSGATSNIKVIKN